MSYARFVEPLEDMTIEQMVEWYNQKDFTGKGSEVYVFHHVGGYLICMGCKRESMNRGFHEDFIATTWQEMIDHIESHLKWGDRIPVRCLEQLREDQKADPKNQHIENVA